jgi:hypothetical protein
MTTLHASQNSGISLGIIRHYRQQAPAHMSCSDHCAVQNVHPAAAQYARGCCAGMFHAFLLPQQAYLVDMYIKVSGHWSCTEYVSAAEDPSVTCGGWLWHVVVVCGPGLTVLSDACMHQLAFWCAFHSIVLRKGPSSSSPCVTVRD